MTRTLTVLCVALLLTAPDVAAQNWLSSARYYPAADVEGVDFQAHGDIDNDGDVDLFAADRFSQHYQVFLNDGGDLTALPMVPLPDSLSVRVRQGLADVTGDGNLDAFYTHHTTEAEFRIMPGNGDGTFGPDIVVPIGWLYYDHVLADIDDDGTFEVGMASQPAQFGDIEVRWWIWNGATLVPAPAVIITHSGGPSVESLAVLDFNGDRVEDMVIGAGFDESIIPLMTTGVRVLEQPAVPVPFNSTGVHLAVGDLDGDGDEDLLASGVEFIVSGPELDHFAAMFLDGGSFTAGPVTTLAWSDYVPFDLTIVDWDLDGDGDLLVPNPDSFPLLGQFNGIAVFAHDGSGNFEEVAYYRTNTPATGGGVVDFDGDGINDIIGPRCIVYGNGRAEDQPAASFGGAGSTLPLVGFWDLEDDGDLDAWRETGDILINDASGRFPVPYPPTVPFPPLDYPLGWDGLSTVGDFTGDGIDDLIVQQVEFILFGGQHFLGEHLLVGDGRGGFTDAGLATDPFVRIGYATGFPEAVDVDDDGDNDLVTGNGYWENDGSGYFTRVDLFVGEPRAVADFDDDGDLDILTSLRHDFFIADLALQRHDGNLGFTAEPLLTGEDLSIYGGSFVDLDEDGDTDIAIGSRFDGTIWLFVNDGAGNLTMQTLMGVGSQSDTIGVDDVDGDGIGDLITADSANYGSDDTDAMVQVFRRTSPTALTYEPPRTWVGGTTRGILDIDQDGDLDLVGGHMIYNNRHAFPESGGLRQFGSGVPGTDGYQPLLGGAGPIRPGSTTASIRYRLGLGGGTVWLLGGLGQTELEGPFPGMTFYLDPITDILVLPSGGAWGEGGAGNFDLVFPEEILQIGVGFTFYLQAFGVDPAAPFGHTSTPALELTFGL